MRIPILPAVLVLGIATVPATVHAQSANYFPITGNGLTHAQAYNSMVNNDLWMKCRNQATGQVVPGSVTYDPPLPGGVIIANGLGNCGKTVNPGDNPPVHDKPDPLS